MSQTIFAQRGAQVNEYITFKLETCITCGIPFMMPADLMQRLRDKPGTSFYCPNGHNMHYTSKTEAQKLREELEQVRRNKDQTIDSLLDDINTKQKTIRKQTRDLNRFKRGVCSCCNRSFANLEQHMRKQHPEQLKK